MVGTHLVSLAEVAANCIEQGEQVRRVDVAENESVIVLFEVVCSAGS